jgi:hypothetical protein
MRRVIFSIRDFFACLAESIFIEGNGTAAVVAWDKPPSTLETACIVVTVTHLLLFLLCPLDDDLSVPFNNFDKIAFLDAEI